MNLYSRRFERSYVGPVRSGKLSLVAIVQSPCSHSTSVRANNTTRTMLEYIFYNVSSIEKRSLFDRNWKTEKSAYNCDTKSEIALSHDVNIYFTMLWDLRSMSSSTLFKNKTGCRLTFVYLLELKLAVFIKMILSFLFSTSIKWREVCSDKWLYKVPLTQMKTKLL